MAEGWQVLYQSGLYGKTLSQNNNEVSSSDTKATIKSLQLLTLSVLKVEENLLLSKNLKWGWRDRWLSS